MALNLSKLKGLEDSALVERALEGERRAFSELVRRHQSQVYRVCYRILGQREDARDAAQEAFIRAYNRLDTFQGRSAFSTWLTRLAVNVSLNQRGKRSALPLEESPAEASPGPEAEAMRSDDAARLHAALQKLQENHRAALVLHDLEGLSWEEAAAALAVPEGTARSWAHRGRNRLKDLLT